MNSPSIAMICTGTDMKHTTNGGSNQERWFEKRMYGGSGRFSKSCNSTRAQRRKNALKNGLSMRWSSSLPPVVFSMAMSYILAISSKRMSMPKTPTTAPCAPRIGADTVMPSAPSSSEV